VLTQITVIGYYLL